MATIADLPQMWVGTSANYEALETKVNGAIYFLTDTRQIAKGSVKYSQEAQIVDSLPGSGIRGYIYFNTTDGIAYIYTGTEFKAIGVITISDITSAKDADVPNVGAVKTYVAAQVAAGVANKVDKVAGKQLSTEDYTTAEKTKLATYPENYSTVTALIDSKVASVYKYKGTVENQAALPQADQVVGDVYHVTEGAKEFVWDGTKWEELGGIVDLSDYYTKTQVDSAIDTDVEAARSALQTNIDAKAAKVASAVEGNLAGLSAAGDLTDAGVKAGGATLNAAPNGTTLATESAVKAAVDTAANTKVTKVTGAVENNVVAFAANGEVKDSGVKVGGSSFADVNSDTTLATEAGVKAWCSDMVAEGGSTKMNYVDVSDANEVIIADADGDAKASGVKIGGTSFSASAAGTTLALEQAIIDLLAWKTIPEA